MKSFFGLVAVLFSLSSFGQILNPVKWSWKAVPAGKDEYKLQFTATIDKGWHTYSQFQGNDGAVPTSFKYEPNKSVTLVGRSTETCAKTHEGIDDVFGVLLVNAAFHFWDAAFFYFCYIRIIFHCI